MSIPGAANSLLLRTAAAGGYNVERSLRFNSSDSAFCSRTFSSAGNRKTWTWAGWVKRSAFGSYQYLFCAGTSESTDQSAIRFNTDETIDFFYFTGSFQWRLNTTQVFRDPSSWYHIVAVCDTDNATANSRARLYVNGSEVTVFATRTNPASGSTSVLNNNVEHRIGVPSFSTSTYQFSGYLADVHFIDGQALTPSSFTEVSATTGQLIPKAYTGSFGTNGFWLKFSDNSAATATTLGKDYSGNSNNWTPNNLSVTAGAGNDSLTDTPTSYGTDTGAGGEVRGNYATLNPLDATTPSSLSNGNLDQNGGNNVRATIGGIGSGKWYWEFTKTSDRDVSANSVSHAGILPNTVDIVGLTTHVFLRDDGQLRENGSAVGTYATWTNGDVISIAMNNDAAQYSMYKNGSLLFTRSYPSGITAANAFPAVRNNTGQSGVTNFGQRPWAYAPPANYLPLVDTLLPAPAVAKPSTAMDVALWTGLNSANARTISGLQLSPDLVWIKNRTVGYGHQLFDAVRGATRALQSNTTGAELLNDVAGTLSSFNSDGFTTSPITNNSSFNDPSHAYVAWTWDAGTSTVTNTQGSITSQVRANASAGFSIVTYTGTGAANSTFGHGLGVAPALIITKNRGSANDWYVYHSSLGVSSYLSLNTTGAVGTLSNYWNPVNSTVFGQTYTSAGPNNGSQVAYCFAPVAGYSSFGAWTNNGSTDGVFIYTGMRPRFILLKNTDNVEQWFIFDSARRTYNVQYPDPTELRPNSSAAEGSYSLAVTIDFLSNGFKIRGTTTSEISFGTRSYIYAAFAESPFQYARAR